MSFYSYQSADPKDSPGTTQVAPGGGATPAPAAPGGSMVTMLLPFLILVPFLFMSFRRQKKEQEQRKNLKKGDKVVTNAGLIGELVELEERVAKVKIAPGTTVQVLATALSSFDATPAAASKTDKDLADLKDAKVAIDKK